MREGWIDIKLEEVLIRLSNGYSGKQSSDYIGDPISRIETIWNEGIDVKRVKYIPVDEVVRNKYRLQKEDILFSHINSDIHLGKTAIYRGTPEILIHGINTLLIRVSKLLDSKFFLYQFRYLRHKGLFVENAQRSVNQSSINQRKLKAFNFNLPPLPEQRAIAAKIEELFSSLDNGIANLKKAQEQLKVYRQAVLKQAFEGELTKEWRKKQTNLPSPEELLEQIKSERENYYTQQIEEWEIKVKEWEKNGKAGKKPGKPRRLKDYEPIDKEALQELVGLPKGWMWLQLQYLSDITGGVTKGRKLDGKETIELPYLRVANVQDGYLDLSLVKQITVLPSDLNKYRLEYGDILYTEGGDRDKLGRGTIWKNEVQDCIHQNHIFRARLYVKEMPFKYITYFSQTRRAKKYFYDNGKHTTNLASINKTVLSELPLKISSIKEQHQIVQEIESRLSVCDKVEESIEVSLKKAEALKQSILKKAFDGALLSELELKACRHEADWEPAEVLLAKIKEQQAVATPTKKQAKKKTKTKATPKPISETDLHAAIICKVIKAHDAADQLDKLGHVKCEKIVHFAEYHLGLSVGRKPVKDAAGPDDYPHLKKVESRAKKAGFFFIDKRDVGYSYKSGTQTDKLIAKLDDKIDGKICRLEQLTSTRTKPYRR